VSASHHTTLRPARGTSSRFSSSSDSPSSSAAKLPATNDTKRATWGEGRAGGERRGWVLGGAGTAQVPAEWGAHEGEGSGSSLGHVYDRLFKNLPTPLRGRIQRFPEPDVGCSFPPSHLRHKRRGELREVARGGLVARCQAVADVVGELIQLAQAPLGQRAPSPAAQRAG
jgi:hypothetical protein